MPFTPFHFGPAAALKAAAPTRFSFTVFCYAQVVTDLETGFYLVRGEYPVHRFFHTYLGGAVVGHLAWRSGSLAPCPCLPNAVSRQSADAAGLSSCG